MDRSFTENQLKEVYRDIIDKTEYHDFHEWFSDMLKSGLILHKEERKTTKLQMILWTQLQHIWMMKKENRCILN